MVAEQLIMATLAEVPRPVSEIDTSFCWCRYTGTLGSRRSGTDLHSKLSRRMCNLLLKAPHAWDGGTVLNYRTVLGPPCTLGSLSTQLFSVVRSKCHQYSGRRCSSRTVIVLLPRPTSFLTRFTVGIFKPGQRTPKAAVASAITNK